ncbi:MAG: hypothetical protein ACYSWP_21945, partial [Planctomycetota bacterium]
RHTLRPSRIERYKKIQNKANSTNAGNKVKDTPEAAQLNNQSSIIDNQWKGEPNLTDKMT